MIRATVIACSLGLLAVQAQALEVETYLDATREIENWDGRDGRHGERGAYGIRAATWAQHMGDMDFAHARQERWGRECARRHVRWLQRELVRAGVHLGVFNVAMAYNAGLTAVLESRVPESAYDYATRLQNLYLNAETGRQKPSPRSSRRQPIQPSKPPAASDRASQLRPGLPARHALQSPRVGCGSGQSRCSRECRARLSAAHSTPRWF